MKTRFIYECRCPCAAHEPMGGACLLQGFSPSGAQADEQAHPEYAALRVHLHGTVMACHHRLHRRQAVAPALMLGGKEAPVLAQNLAVIAVFHNHAAHLPIQLADDPRPALALGAWSPPRPGRFPAGCPAVRKFPRPGCSASPAATRSIPAPPPGTAPGFHNTPPGLERRIGKDKPHLVLLLAAHVPQVRVQRLRSPLATRPLITRRCWRKSCRSLRVCWM